MDLELKKSCFDAYDTGTELILSQEESAETIVPDYCPDIARIIDTDGKVFLHSRELREGKAELSGTVRVTVLYTPEGEGGIRTMEFAMPFSVESDSRALPDCSCLCAETEMEFLETRILNPRKIFTHCKLVTRLTGYRRVSLCFCTDVTADPTLGIEKKQELQRTSVLTHIAEKDFTFSDELHLSPGKEGAAEILTSRAAGTVTESKVVGSKLILKGVFTVCLLYRAPSGKYCSASGELPFSQILEIEGAEEDATALVTLQMTGTDVQVGSAAEQDGRQIAVTLYLHATAILREEREITLLSDLYSTVYDLTYEAEPMKLTDFAESISRRQSVREILEIGVVADSILSLTVSCGTVSVAREGENITLRTTATIRALYTDEGGVPLMAERGMEVSCQLDLPAECQVAARAFCPEEPQGSLGDRGIEVRFPIEFRAQAHSSRKRVCVSGAKLNAEAPKDFSSAPSLVLRSLGREETLWAVAKQYSTTIPTILAANELAAEQDVPREQLLLIPRKRV